MEVRKRICQKIAVSKRPLKQRPSLHGMSAEPHSRPRRLRSTSPLRLKSMTESRHSATQRSSNPTTPTEQNVTLQDITTSITGDLFETAWMRCRLRSQAPGHTPRALQNKTSFHDSWETFHSFSDHSTPQRTSFRQPTEPLVTSWRNLPAETFKYCAYTESRPHHQLTGTRRLTPEPSLLCNESSPEDFAARNEDKRGSRVSNRRIVEGSVKITKPQQTGYLTKQSHCQAASAHYPTVPSKIIPKNQSQIVREESTPSNFHQNHNERSVSPQPEVNIVQFENQTKNPTHILMSSNTESNSKDVPAQHKPLVVGRTKPRTTASSAMDTSTAKGKEKEIPAQVAAELNQEIDKNVRINTTAAAPSEDNQPTKKEKAPKQSKPPKAAPAVAPLSPALIDLRVGHILRAMAHPNADSLYVSTIAMGDPEGTEHTQVDEETGKVVRTVCSGLNGLVPLEEMQNRKIVVVANLKPVNMRSIKSAAMVLAASPAMEEGADPHAVDRVVELVNPPEGSEAGDKVYFEGWAYGEGKGPEKQLNPKKKQWEAIQPGFFTGEDLSVGFDASKSEVEGEAKGKLVVEGKGVCTVKSLKGAVVR